MRLAQYSLVLLLLWTALPLPAAEPPDAAALVAVLRSDAPKAEKAITCKRLAVFGTEEAVPALAPLLQDAELASWARIALEAIPGPAADKALRDALPKLEGRLLVGVVNSIGAGRDAQAVGPLVGLLKAGDAEVASAAAVALGQIGSAEATEALRTALAEAPDAVRSAVAEGCVLSAEQLMASGKLPEAAALYDQVRQAAVPKPRVVEATRGAILARGTDGVGLLLEQFQSEDKALFAIGLSTARELPGTAVTEALVAALPKVAAERRPLVILALADRGDAAVLPAMLEVAKDGPDSVRVAAINVVKQLGNASCIPVLLQLAATGQPEAAAAARQALEALPGDDVSADLAQRLPQAKGAERLVLIGLAGQRRLAAVPALVAAAGDADAAVRAAALLALGETVGLDQVSFLIQRAVAPEHAEDGQPAAKALQAACVRMPDREACAGQLVAAMSKAAPAPKATLLETLGAMEGAIALQAIGAAARGKDPELQDLASQLLGKWMSVDAAPVLLDLARSDIDSKYQVRALRGFIRIVRQFDVPDVQRVQMCSQALEAAQRDDEKQLVLEVLQRYPSVDAMRLAVQAAKVPTLAETAKATALAIAQQIGGSADVRELLAQAGQEPVQLEIVKAQYGAGTTFKNVTDVVRSRAGSLPLIVLPSSSYNSAFGGDPVPSVVKQLKIEYRLNGKAGEATFPENATILLPVPK
ncbi:MAG: HEAT repeat domain-containing protein [Thermoguttaceae bacterium]